MPLETFLFLPSPKQVTAGTVLATSQKTSIFDSSLVTLHLTNFWNSWKKGEEG